MFQNSKCRLHDLKAITPTLKSSIKFILNNFISNSELKYSFWSSYGRLSFQIKLQKEKLHTTRRTIVLRNGYIMVIYHLKKKTSSQGWLRHMVQRRMDEGARRGLRCCCADVCYRSPSEESCGREYGSCGASMSVLQRLCTCCYVYLRASITQPVSQMLFWQRNSLWESSEVDKQLLHLPCVSGAQNIMRQRTGQRDCSAASLFWARGTKMAF